MSAIKHPSARSRARDAKRGGEFRVLPAGGAVAIPPWPLPKDVAATAVVEVNRDKMAGLQVDIESAEDGRTRGRLKRQLEQLELATTKLQLEIELAADAEVALWAELWAMPQAQMWIESHAHREVAQYVRWKVRGEAGNLEAAKEARMLSDRLGLNPLALLRLRAEVEQVQRAEDEGKRRREKKPAVADAAPKKKPDDPRGFLSSVS